MSAENEGKAVPVYVRIGLLLLLVIVALGGAAFGLWVTGFWPTSPGIPSEPASGDGEPLEALISAAVLLVLGVLALIAGIGGYFIVLAAQCFIFDFDAPVLPRLKGRLYAANIIVPMFLLGGVAAILGAPLSQVLISAGAPSAYAVGGSVLGLFFLLQMVMIWLQIWAPLEKSIITRRLGAYGITPQQLTGAAFVGISDPSRSSLKKLTLVEDDIGALWITPEVLAYRGDDDHFDIRPEQFIAMQRKADKWSTTSLAGAIHVLVRFRTSEGGERVVRFHVEGGWTLRAKARAMDRLAEQIGNWAEKARANRPQAEQVDHLEEGPAGTANGTMRNPKSRLESE
jgi:hypothetical protein